MNVYATEDEQVEAIKKWWKDNGKSVIGGVIIGVAVLYGGRMWFEQRNQHIENASAEYEAMIQDLNQDKQNEAADRGAAILGQYSDTTYGELAALAMAKIKVDENDLVAAKSHLQWALDHAKQDEIKRIARLRLARVLHAEGKEDEALQLLNVAAADKFAAAYDELKGDIYVAKGDVAKARTHYDLALQSLEPTSRARRYIEMKLDDLGQPATEVKES
ncbi:MAG: tetratricopeptide repeat protein [Gammaproteobacteria bacterium]